MRLGTAAIRCLFTAVPFLLLTTLLIACGGDANAKPTPVPFPGSTWSVQYSVSGGMAGIRQSVVLDWKGNLVTEDGRLNRSRQGYVQDLSAIDAGLRAANLASLKSDEGLPHPDAIVTSIKVFSGNLTYGATFNRAPEQGAVADLLRRLGALYDANRP